MEDYDDDIWTFECFLFLLTKRIMMDDIYKSLLRLSFIFLGRHLVVRVKLCFLRDDFQRTVKESFAKYKRGRYFTGVTLVCEDEEAKIILFFRRTSV